VAAVSEMMQNLAAGPDSAVVELRRRYLDLVKQALTRLAFEDKTRLPEDPRVSRPLDLALREAGKDWPVHAETMIGLRRLDNLQYAVETVIGEGVQGDLIETGVWRGGASILMRAVLAAHGDTTRTVWAADSFKGLPKPDPRRYPADMGTTFHLNRQLAVSVEEVRRNFARYGLLDKQVRFLPGWFRDTLPTAPIERIAVLRLDGDLYESTIVALESLYPKMAPGGFVIVDDYNDLTACREATDAFRASEGITAPLVRIDWTGVYWRAGYRGGG
jgi:O-methyltransferase